MKTLLILASFAFFGCAHIPKDTIQTFTDSDSVLKDQRLKNYSINIRCSIVDLNGKRLWRFQSLFCRFLDDGSFYASGGTEVAKYDRNLNKVWGFNLNMNHHQLVLSPYTSNLLTLDAYEYRQGGQIYRGDHLLIIDPNGKLIKRLDFSDILGQAEKRGYAKKPPVEAVWVSKFTNPPVSVLEHSHVNSFYEMWDSAAGKVSGYVVNCYHQQKIYILDSKAEKLLNVIDMDGRKIHDVQMYNDKLYFYVNSDLKSDKSWLSYLASYDITAKKLEVVYQSGEEAYSGNACSSVQPVADGLFAVLHSNCAPTSQTTPQSKLEIIDVYKKIRYRPKFEKFYQATNAYLFMSESFLKNNNGL